MFVNTIKEDDDSPKKATLCIFHGFGENSELFLEYAMQFALNGYTVIIPDWRGFGFSGGPKLGVTVSDNHHDIVSVLKICDPELPVFFYGHSMGCLITSTFLMNNPGLNISGVIFQAPLFGTHPHKEPTGIKEFLTIDQADNI